MVDTMKCPFCGAELRESSAVNEWYCPRLSKLCPMRGSLPKIVWQALISGKAAQDLLHDVSFIYLESVKADIQESPIDWEKTARRMYEATQTKQDNQ